jgi:hypothetical protein
MTPEEFLAAIEKKSPPALDPELLALEHTLGTRLPEEYRAFLVSCNGGYVGGALWFTGPTPTGEDAEAGIHHVGGFREESYFSLAWHLECYEDRIPHDLLWIMDDPFGNAICLGLRGEHHGQIFFWDHENEPDEEWDGSVENAGNIQLLALSFAAFVKGVHPNDAA